MPQFRIASLFVAAGAAMLALAACNETRAPTGLATAAPGASPASLGMSSETGCGGDVARLRAVIDDDVRVGHLNRSVYDRMTADLDRASAACAAGREAEAIGLVRTTKARYGYP